MVVLQLISERSRAYERTSLELGRVRTESDVPYGATRIGLRKRAINTSRKATVAYPTIQRLVFHIFCVMNL